MAFHPFDVSIPHIVYASLGGFVVLFGMFSLLIRERLYIGEAPLAFVFGIAIGPYGANIFNPRHWGGGSEETVNQITLEFTRVILAVGVFAIGVELPKAYMKRHWKSLFFLLFPVMTWGWLVSAGLIFALVPGLSFLSSLAVAACLTPTDPILAAAVVGGKYANKHVPIHLRHLLAAESGCNDGAAFPFLYLALYLVISSNDAHAIEDWFLITWLYEVILGTVFGSLIGWAFRHLMKFCERKDLIDRQSYVAQYVALALFTIGVTTLLGSDDLLAAFACGTAFAWDGFFNRQTEASVFSSVIDLLFNIAAFVFIGAWMPFSDFADPELTLTVWRLIVIALLVLLLRRLPIILVLFRWIPDVKTFREAVFSGHFGPMGVGAVFISTLAAEKLGPALSRDHSAQLTLLAKSIQPIVAFMVLCSITIHGMSIPFFSLGRRVHSVSRTWSRHTSMDPIGGPEWQTHTRTIKRGDQIVINRDKDSAMERGELPGILDETKTGDGKEKMVESPDAMSIADLDAEEKRMGEGEHAATASTSPDGTREWLEGQDVVVERRCGPGDEVDVEVLHDAAPPRADGDASGVEEMKKAVYDKWVGAAEGVRRVISPEMRQRLDGVGIGKGEDEGEDDGWASDGSGPNGSEAAGSRSRSPSPIPVATSSQNKSDARNVNPNETKSEKDDDTDNGTNTNTDGRIITARKGKRPVLPTPSKPMRPALFAHALGRRHSSTRGIGLPRTQSLPTTASNSDATSPLPTPILSPRPVHPRQPPGPSSDSPRIRTPVFAEPEEMYAHEGGEHRHIHYRHKTGGSGLEHDHDAPGHIHDHRKERSPGRWPGSNSHSQPQSPVISRAQSGELGYDDSGTEREAEADGEEEERGRSKATAASMATAAALANALRRTRVHTLRTHHRHHHRRPSEPGQPRAHDAASRSASPARSIRSVHFVGDRERDAMTRSRPASGTSTPRIFDGGADGEVQQVGHGGGSGSSPNTTGSGSSSSGVLPSPGTGSGARVAFDIPSSPR
ncbi:hypothetical protein BD410DRAFT_749069 [Rickenella mellea]|uniref:Cation/H+ exchanger transmembrane domain-containing protein n=1 Tax=Rickenella mellea TaxID=50990 RepID=A0A4Y7Q3N0_9AGAM|nr:hypothetical protein BD410DRAFT_749069 [Rickenella mellea]